MDLGCPRTVRSVEGKDRHLLFYSSQYSNNKKKWTTLATDDETRYDKNLKVSAKAMLMFANFFKSFSLI